jgi:hypothetical protein
MREAPFCDRYSCTPVCRVVVRIDGMTAAIGPAGDAVYVPLRISGGRITGAGVEKTVIGGSDFAVMYADETLVHSGRFVAADPAGDVLVWYDGASQAAEGAYDDVLDGRLPGKIPCRLGVHIVSTSPEMRALSRKPLIGMGHFDGDAGTLDVIVLTVHERAGAALNG